MTGTEQSVRCAPSITSFNLALVSATLMRLSSARIFPACCFSLLRTCKGLQSCQSLTLLKIVRYQHYHPDNLS